MIGGCNHDKGRWEYHRPTRNRKKCVCGLIATMTPEECWRNREQWEPSENDAWNRISST